MVASELVEELVEELEKLIKEHGDCQVLLTDWSDSLSVANNVEDIEHCCDEFIIR